MVEEEGAGAFPGVLIRRGLSGSPADAGPPPASRAERRGDGTSVCCAAAMLTLLGRRDERELCPAESWSVRWVFLTFCVSSLLDIMNMLADLLLV